MLFLTFHPFSNVFFHICAFGFVLKVFDWSHFTAKIMNTVNITVPDTEKVINYSPNYYRRLNLILARYTKRFVPLYLVVCSCFCVCKCVHMHVFVRFAIVCVCGGGSSQHAMKTAAHQLLIYCSFEWVRAPLNILSLLAGIYRTTWYGALLWTWWLAWAEHTETPGKPTARYASRPLTLNLPEDKHKKKKSKTPQNQNMSMFPQSCVPLALCSPSLIIK